ncbi:MAG: hypothetical protein WC119_01685 [Synergistaceae bacterium]
MKIEIPDEIARQIGIAGLSPKDIAYEVTELAWRVLPRPTGDEKTDGILIYAKDSLEDKRS